MSENIYSQLKWFGQRKKAEMNKGKSQRGTVYRNLNSKCSCWILRMCEKISQKIGEKNYLNLTLTSKKSFVTDQIILSFLFCFLHISLTTFLR